MKAFRHLVAILAIAVMIFCGVGADGFGALSFAIDDQNDPAVSQDADVESEVSAEAEQDDADNSADSDASSDSGLIHNTLSASKVKLEGMMPEGAEATATDASSTKAVRQLQTYP